MEHKPSIDIYEYINRKEGHRTTKDIAVRSRGQDVAAEDSTWTITSLLTPVAALDENDQKIWWALITHKISISNPAGIKAETGYFGMDLFLGRVKITARHDEDAQKPVLLKAQKAPAGAKVTFVKEEMEIGKIIVVEDQKVEDKTTHARVETVEGRKPVVSCEASGPKSATESKNISNSVSQDLGVNVGIFGNTPTAGASASFSVSHSVSETIESVSILNKTSSRNTVQTWEFDFSRFGESNQSKSGFAYTVQEIWRIADAGTDPESLYRLQNLAFRLDVEWEPQVKTQVGEHVFEPLFFADKCSESFALEWDGKIIPHEIVRA